MNTAERRIRAYEEMGDHRTGRAADNAATAWMIDELASVGVHAEPQEWTFPQVDWSDASVRVNGTSVPGVPLFDGALTSVSGNLAQPGAPGIVVSPIAHGDGTQFSQAMYPHLNTLREGGAEPSSSSWATRTAITPSATPSDRSIRSTSPSSRSRPTTQPRCSRARPERASGAALNRGLAQDQDRRQRRRDSSRNRSGRRPSHADDAQVGLVHLRRRARRRHRNLDRSRRPSRSRAGPSQPQHRRLQRTRAAPPRP